MPDYRTWTGTEKRNRDWRRAVDPRPSAVGALIADKPTEITIVRGSGADLDPQTVRIDVFGSASTERRIGQSAGFADISRVLITGYKNHPTEDDLDIRQDDRFLDDEGRAYRVLTVEAGMTDRTLAVAEAET